MLLDVIENYDKEKSDYLVSLWKKTIKHLSNSIDSKKLVSFLGKCAILGIDEKEKNVYIGVPNEFVASQVKKFFNKELNNSVKDIYNPYFSVKIEIYQKLQNGSHFLQTDINKILGIKNNGNNSKPASQAPKSIDSSTKERLKDFFGVLFDSKYKFNNFIVGSNNQLAFSAAKQVSQHPGTVYNPLFIYGNVGLGKTHLLQAVGNNVMKNHPEKVVVYLPTTKLIEEIIDAIRKNKLSSLMKKLEGVDVLILDDIQFLAEKEKTQEIFHNIFNDFHMKQKQIILSSDRAPKELNLLEARLRSRFANGLVTDIKRPDYETRIAILQSKLKEKSEELEGEFLDTIAKYVKDNIREIEGALNIVLTRKNLLDKEIEKDDILESLETLGYEMHEKENLSQKNIDGAGQKNSQSGTNFSKVVEYLSSYYSIDVEEVKGNSRKKAVSQARQMLMFIAKKYFGWTLERIGEYFGGKNHASVIYSINNFEKKLKDDTQLNKDLNIILEEIGV